MPFRLGVTTTAWGPVVGVSASTLVALRFGGRVGDVFSFIGVAWDVGVVVRGFMALDVVAFVRAAGLLVNPYADPVELIIRISLPWFIGLVGAVRRWHAVALAIWGSIIALEGVVPVCLKHMSHNILVRG